MKVLHTSDWHLGHALYGHDRAEEQQSMLDQMVEIVREHRPDVFLLCGDVFHISQPSSGAQTMFSDALVSLRDACLEMTIIVTAGNHDSASRHEVFRTPWRSLGVHVIGNIHKDAPAEHIIEIPGKGFVVAVPYAHERNIPEGFFQQLLDLTAQRNVDSLPVVLTAHTTVRGCDFMGHDQVNEYVVGGVDYIDVDALGEGYDYLALGHIHRGQFVHTGRHNVRYCGTPLPVSFDEDFPHTVSMVELAGHGERPQINEIEIANPRPLVTLPVEGFATFDNALEALRAFPADVKAYIRLNVEVDGFLKPGAFDVAQQAAADKQCTVCYINTYRKAVATAAAKAMSVQELQKETPLNLARRYAEDAGMVFDDEMAELFEEAMRQVKEETRND